ncbi:MAG: hypothetical protein KDD55_05580 [Bdellovibrionales bacterium]|nr:hypothetical protein [Bdellovibrionales bacterium]
MKHILWIIFILAGVFWFIQDKSELPEPNADGLIESFEGTPIKPGGAPTSISLYNDQILFENPDGEEDSLFNPEEVVIMIKDIKKLNAFGTNFVIRSMDGSSIEFQLLNGRKAGAVKEKLRELMKELGAPGAE